MVMTRYGARCNGCGTSADLLSYSWDVAPDGRRVFLCGGCQPDPVAPRWFRVTVTAFALVASLLVGAALGWWLTNPTR